MMQPSQRLGAFQLYCMLLQSQFGSAIVSLSHDVNAVAGTSAWISCLIGGIINNIFIFSIWFLTTNAAAVNGFQMLMQRLGGIAGRVVLSMMAVIYGVISYVILINWLSTTDVWAYERTPIWFLLLIIIAICTYLITQPIVVYARFTVFTTIFVPLFIVFSLYSLHDWHLYNILPLLDTKPLKLLKGALPVFWALLGVEFLLLLPSHYQHFDKKKILRIAIYTNLTTVLLYTYSVVTSTLLLGTETISIIRQPLLYQMKLVAFNVIERIDLIIISIWILFVITSFSSYFRLFLYSISALLWRKPEAPLPLSIACALLFFFAGLWHFNTEQIDRLNHFSNYFSPISSFTIVTLLSILIKIMSTPNKKPGGPS